MQVTTMTRVFVSNGVRLADPDISMSPAQVKDFYAGMPNFADLNNAEISGPEDKGNELEYTFRRTTGTKGAKEDRSADIPFAYRLAQQAAAAAKTQPDQPIQPLASQLHSLLNAGGTPLEVPSEAIPLLI
ncbi:MAG: PRTRC system protein C [Burkholderiales bacterium]|nr:PRTRC system protein C [Burkholderiales bacterium]